MENKSTRFKSVFWVVFEYFAIKTRDFKNSLKTFFVLSLLRYFVIVNWAAYDLLVSFDTLCDSIYKKYFYKSFSRLEKEFLWISRLAGINWNT